MRIPTIQGVIDRRILVNFRIDPEVAARLLPAPFRPKLAGGYAIAGICLIRLKNIRPAFWPLPGGIGSENAAHRYAVEWDQDGVQREGVFIPRRDTNSRFNALVGGRLFPGVHHHARFDVAETSDLLRVALTSDDGDTRVSVVARPAERLPDTSVFSSLEAVSQFFEAGSVGYSATSDPARFDGLELQCRAWRIEPLAVEAVESSYFDDVARFPSGSVEFDCALLMRNIEHRWQGLGQLCCASGAVLSDA